MGGKPPFISAFIELYRAYPCLWKVKDDAYAITIRNSEVKENEVSLTSKLAEYIETAPNIVHYVIFNRTNFDFIVFLSVTSVLKVQRPSEILIHSDSTNGFSGYYWNIVSELSQKLEIPIRVVFLPRPTHVFGQRLSSVYHSTDVARIQVLMSFGGIYIDTDVLILQPLDEFLKYEMTLGWPPNENIGTQVLIAKKNARFLELWLDGYRKYKARSWYYNAGQYPTEQILAKDKSIAHTVPKLFGVHNLLDKLYGTADWEDWKTYYTLHLLSRHPPAPLELNETTILNYTSPFGEISRWILFDLVPKVRISTAKEFYKSSTTWKPVVPVET